MKRILTALAIAAAASTALAAVEITQSYDHACHLPPAVELVLAAPAV
jgi:hypothetical protein